MKKTISVLISSSVLIGFATTIASACPWANASVTTQSRVTYYYQVNEDCTFVVSNRKGKSATNHVLTYQKKSFLSKTEGWQFTDDPVKVTFLPDGIGMKISGPFGTKKLRIKRTN